MGQDRSSVSCDDEGKPADYRSDWERREAELADTHALAEAIAASVVTHAARIEDLHRRVEALEVDRAALREALMEAFGPQDFRGQG